MGKIIGRKSIISIIGACIIIGLASQAQLAQKDDSGSPLYDFRAAQAFEELGLTPNGSANSNLEFGSMATAGLTVRTTAQTKRQFPPLSSPQTGSLACPPSLPPTGSMTCPPPQTGSLACP